MKLFTSLFRTSHIRVSDTTEMHSVLDVGDISTFRVSLKLIVDSNS